jgi:hypothetical protein
MKRYKGIVFYRCFNEVFIFTSSNDVMTFNNKEGYALLDELNLTGNIVSIGSGDDPILFSNSHMLFYKKKIVFLDSSGRVQVCNPEEFF